MLKALRHRAETVFVLVLLWKVTLLIFTAQPMPANDSFFYDGAVVNYLLHGQYCNPAIANALPISGAEVFSAYPPLYQLSLLGWMRVAGTSVLAAMWFHFLLFAVYAGLLLATLRQMQVPTWCVHFAGAFLLGITFHDRPDSLAQVLGMVAVYASVRAFGGGLETSGRKPASCWFWLAASGVVLCLCTSLQIGGIYFLLIWLALLLQSRLLRRPAAWPALVAMTLVPVILVCGVKLLWPHLWAGFQEHARQTPSLTSWRMPEALEAIKIVRSVPGLLLVLALLPLTVLPTFCRQLWPGSADTTSAGCSPETKHQLKARQLAILLSASVATIAVLVAALCFWTPNLVAVAGYLQPLIVGVFLALWTGLEESRFKLVAVKLLLGLSMLLAATRAIGLTTVGVACARDVSRSEALKAVARELAAAPANAAVVLSAAYLYDPWPEEGRLRLSHCDWVGPAVKGQPNAEVDALRAVKPTRLILTQFDYYRRYMRVLAQLQATTSTVSVRVENLARMHPPDASPRWQRVVQHVSWAPVIVTLEWN